MSNDGPSNKFMPTDVSSLPRIVPTSAASSGFHVAPSAMWLGKGVNPNRT